MDQELKEIINRLNDTENAIGLNVSSLEVVQKTMTIMRESIEFSSKTLISVTERLVDQIINRDAVLEHCVKRIEVLTTLVKAHEAAIQFDEQRITELEKANGPK